MIVIGGENLIDFIQVGIDDGIPTYKAMPGGSPFNIAMAIGRQNVNVGYLTPVSSDPLGNLLAARLMDSDVTLLSPRRTEPTSLAVVALEHGVAAYQFYRQQTAERMITPDGLVAATPDSVSAICLGSLAITDGTDAEIWAKHYCDLKNQQVFTALDPNIRAAFIHDRAAYEKRLDHILHHTDLLKCSDEDLAWLIPDLPFDQAAEQFAKRSSAALVVVTRGGDGAIALFNGARIEVPAAPLANLVDTVGAGDTFMATLLATLSHWDALSRSALMGLDADQIRQLIARAAKAAAINCSRSGCNPPHLSELE